MLQLSSERNQCKELVHAVFMVPDSQYRGLVKKCREMHSSVIKTIKTTNKIHAMFRVNKPTYIHTYTEI